METGLVSIIMPAFNSEKFILEAIQSVKMQTYANWELLIIDDCSSDATVDLISKQELLDSRIKVFKLINNSGAGIARQLGIDNARGQYIAFLDSDDLWKPKKLETQLNFLDKNDLAVTFSSYELINENGFPLNTLIKAPNKVTYNQLFYCNWIGNLTGIYDTTKCGKIAISNFRKRQDWIMWLDILKAKGFAISCQESLAFYRVRKNSISASKISLLYSNFTVYKNYHNQNFIHAGISMLKFLFQQILIKKRFVVKL